LKILTEVGGGSNQCILQKELLIPTTFSSMVGRVVTILYSIHARATILAHIHPYKLLYHNGSNFYTPVSLALLACQLAIQIS